MASGKLIEWLAEQIGESLFKSGYIVVAMAAILSPFFLKGINAFLQKRFWLGVCGLIIVTSGVLLVSVPTFGASYGISAQAIPWIMLFDVAIFLTSVFSWGIWSAVSSVPIPEALPSQPKDVFYESLNSSERKYLETSNLNSASIFIRSDWRGFTLVAASVAIALLGSYLSGVLDTRALYLLLVASGFGFVAYIQRGARRVRALNIKSTRTSGSVVAPS